MIAIVELLFGAGNIYSGRRKVWTVKKNTIGTLLALFVVLSRLSLGKMLYLVPTVWELYSFRN